MCALRSMTGFGRGQNTSESLGYTFNVEIQSVNRKTFDTQLNGPRDWSGFESVLNTQLASSFTRGRITLQLKLEPLVANACNSALAVDPKQVGQAITQIRALSEANQIPFDADASFLLDLVRSLQGKETIPSWEACKTIVQRTVEVALEDIDLMRRTEGHALEEDFKERLFQFRALIDVIEKEAKEQTANYHAKLLDRLRSMNLEVDLDDERVLKEIALFADRSDISEEITRLKAHVDQFEDLLDSTKPVGRKLDFLCQEIHRELNTTGSKSNELEITRKVIDGKNALERIREQVQNIE